MRIYKTMGHAFAVALLAVLACANAEIAGKSRWATEIVPTPRAFQEMEGSIGLSPDIAFDAEASEPVRYATDVLRNALVNLGGNPSIVKPGEIKAGGRDAIVLGERKEWERLSLASDVKPQFSGENDKKDGFVIQPVRHGERTVVIIAGNGPRGVVYGATTFLQLLQRDASGKGAIQLARIEDWPQVPIRAHYVMSHRLGEAIGSWDNYALGKKTIPGELMPKETRDYYLDWLVRHRTNMVYYETGHNVPLPEDLGDLVKESHRRGLDIFAGIRYIAGGGDNKTYLCYSDEKDVKTVMDIYKRYLDLGVDGVAYLADDIRKEHLNGHCERCIKQFGGLAGEQIFMLKQIAGLAKERNLPLDRIYFCPTPYSSFTALKNKADFKKYFEAFTADEIGKQIPFFLTYFDKEQVQGFKKMFGLTYLWWYNGPRPYHYWYRSKWGSIDYPAEADPMYYALFYGWGGIEHKAGVPAPMEADARVKKVFVDIQKETDIFWMCNGGYDGIVNYEYPHAIWGHYAWNPDAFDQAKSEKAIFEIIYGEEGYLLLRELNGLCHKAAMIYFPSVAKPDEVLDLCRKADELCGKLERAYDEHEKTAKGMPPVMRFYARHGLKDFRRAISLFRDRASKPPDGK